MLKKILPSQILWGISLWVFPFTVFTTIWQETFFVQGSHNPYLTANIYIGEVLVFLTFITWLVEILLHKTKVIWHKKNLISAGIVFALTLFSLFFSENVINSAFAQIHILTGLSIFILLTQEIISFQKTQKILILALASQALLAIAQTILQHSIGLSIIGESVIGPNISGIAKISLFGQTFIRSYGTLPHANLLAGFLGLGILLAHNLPNQKLYQSAKLIIWIGFLLAFSKGAILAILICLIASKRISWKMGLPLLGAIFMAIVIRLNSFLSSESFIERIEYIKISLAMIIQHPFGIGLGQFTAHIQEFADLKLQPWQYQPVHNIFLLIANELGLGAGLLSFGGLIYIGLKQKELFKFILFFIIIGLFDHYLFSLPQGIMLGGLLLGLFQNSPQKIRIPTHKIPS